MVDKILLISLMTITSMLYGQKLPSSSMKYIEKSINTESFERVGLTEFNKNNFGKLWLSKQDAVVGFIGANYQRIHIRFLSVIKNQNVQNEYLVYGKSMVENNICDFQGKFRITHIYEFNKAMRTSLYKEALKQNDKEAINKLNKVRGFILAEYILFEDSEQKGSGMFKGVVKSYFYLDKGELFFDDLNIESNDRYNNNQFVGVWQSYNTKIQKACNWGTFRIPNAGDLDIGIGEFFPNKKYETKGWDTYPEVYNKLEKPPYKKDTAWWNK